jgi:hypothetical protein
MPDMRPAPLLLGDLAHAHREIRDLLQRLELDLDERGKIAEEMSLTLAKHRALCTEAVLHLAPTDQDHEQQARLLTAAIQGIDQLVDRLRLPVDDVGFSDNLLQALRTLVVEHERLELELVIASEPRTIPPAGAGTPGT